MNLLINHRLARALYVGLATIAVGTVGCTRKKPDATTENRTDSPAASREIAKETPPSAAPERAETATPPPRDVPAGAATPSEPTGDASAPASVPPSSTPSSPSAPPPSNERAEAMKPGETGTATTTPPAAKTSIGTVFARADLKPTSGKGSGSISFGEAADGSVHLSAVVENISPGLHGFHLHEKGDCSAPLSQSMGAHWNPAEMPHGGPNAKNRHAGDLGNIVVDSDGKGHVDAVYPPTPGVSGSLKSALIGKSVIVHIRGDDLSSQPSGNAGDPLLCGVVTAVDQATAH